MSPRIPIMRYHGGKWKIAPWIIKHFPEHEVYTEPFGGAASILMRKPKSRAEVYNDLDGDIVNVFRVLRDSEKAEILADMCFLTPYSREELEIANQDADDPVERARRTLFRAWGSFGSAGATRGRTGFRTYTRPDKKYTPVATSWTRLPGEIKHFVERLQDVVIENRSAIEVMKQHDTPQTLHYIDPPYLPETRSFDGGRYYRCEMTGKQHQELLEFIKTLSGNVVISGYSSGMYAEYLQGWHMVECNSSGSSRYGSVKRVECIWIKPNKEAKKENQQMRLFQ